MENLKRSYKNEFSIYLNTDLKVLLQVKVEIIC